MIRILPLLFLFSLLTNSFSQSLPIFLDGKTNDWNVSVPTYVDDIDDGNIFDFKYFSVTNDEDFLFIRLNLSPENKLVEENLLTLYIDGDDNSGTGVFVNGIGAELRWDFGFRNGTFYKNGQTFISFPEIQYRSLPTVTDTTYEIAIGRNVLPNGSNLLFTSSTVKIFFKDNVINGDWMPNNGEVFEYSFDDTSTLPIDLIEINRGDNSYLRIMNYNILFDGLLEPPKEQYFTRILQAIHPDIICFNEFFNSDATQVQSKINEMLSLPNGASWISVKLDFGNVTLSKYPITQSWVVYPDHRITASLIDLPSYFNNDLMVINSHYKCCGGPSSNNTRQLEADATIAFILDAKTPGGRIDLPANTPFIILGDLNLVGDRQQLTTLVTGDIINTQFFGNGGPPDWDETDLEDLIAQQTDKRTAYTWRNDGGFFPPGRLDFQIYSNSVMNVEKAFVLQTEVMSADRLAEYGLQQFDTRNASDHFPKVTDYSFSSPIPVELSSFTANVNAKGNVLLNWTTATEINNQMFKIERRSNEGQFITINFVEGSGTTTEPQEYSYIDNSVGTGIYYYRLKQIDFQGTYEYSEEIEINVKGPLTFALEQNFPNPFNPSTSIQYAISSRQFVSLKVYDVLGNEIAALVNEELPAGSYKVEFTARDLVSGIYFYELKTGSFVETKKMILLR